MITVNDNGLYCPAGDFYIDAWKPVKKNIITHAHSDHARYGCGQYYSSCRSVPFLKLRLGSDINVQSFPYGSSFRLGDAEVSLHPAGHILGSAQVRIALNDKVCVISGDYKREHDPSCEPFEVVPCDIFVTESTFGLPIYRWSPIEEVVQDIYEWWNINAKEGFTSLIFCYSLGKTQRILCEMLKYLDRMPGSIALHGSAMQLTKCYEDEGISLAPYVTASSLEGTHGSPHLVLAPPSASRSPWMKKFLPCRTAYASGWMTLRGMKRRMGYDKGFILSDHCDWPALLTTIKQTGARQVYVMHGFTDVLARYLNEQGLVAETLSTLFSTHEDQD